jgi:threonine-phosphate decarboxylase
MGLSIRTPKSEIEMELALQNSECDVMETTPEAQEQRLPKTHGGNVRDAVRRYGIAEKMVVDFSSSINPLGSSPAAKRAARKAIDCIDRYPDMDMSDLRAAIARYYGIKPEQVVCGNGSNALIHLIPRVFRPKKVLVPMPTFSEYAAAVEDAGGEVVPLLLQEQNGYRIDPLDLSFALKGVDMAMLCNPNNPTGALTPKAEMVEILRSCCENGVRLVVDEAFIDFAEADSLVKDAVQSSSLIVLRAFTKFYGMPGLRVGYAIADTGTAQRLRRGQEPWTIDTPSEQAAIAALTDWGYAKKTRRYIAKERARLLGGLRLIQGVEPFPSSANFILLKIAGIDSQLLTDRLGRRGLLVRDCSSFPGLDNRYIRIAVRTWWQNRRLLKALREILGS